MSRPKRQCRIDSNYYEERSEESDNNEDDYDDILENAVEEEHSNRPTGTQSDDEDASSLPDDTILDESNVFDLELESNPADDNESVSVPPSFISPSGNTWHERHDFIGTPGRQPQRNAIRFTSGPTHGANPRSEREAFLMFTEATLISTLQYTNLQGRRVIISWNRENPNKKKAFNPIDMNELEGFIGLIILFGAFRSNYRDVDDLWSSRDGFSVCQATMSRRRFLQIKSFLRFDDPRRRDRQDSLSPIRAVFEQFVSRLRQFYVAGPYLTIDEQLLEFHGRVRFKQYICSKPGKFGIKLFWLCDADMYYILNGFVYIGIGSIQSGERVTSHGVTMHLMKPFLNSGRHLTGDNWFTSVELVNSLRLQNTSYIGTIRSNSRGVPAVARSTAGRQRKDTRIFKDENGTFLVSFWDKGVKPVLLVDNFHTSVTVPAAPEKPSTVLMYNQTKSGVDIADKRLRGFTCKRKCRRWPYAIFSNIIDIATSNASIIYHQRNPGQTRKQEEHYTFLRNLGYQLVDRNIRKRIQQSHLLSSTKIAMKNLGYDVESDTPSVQEPVRMQKSKRCYMCDVKKDRKTYICCPRCARPRCNEHRSHLCANCSN